MYTRPVALLGMLSVLLTLHSPREARARTLPSASCTLEYQRADNMWAAAPNLGWESITVAVGETKTFITDWAYEKLRNDGVRYYGSHLRIATNRGTRNVQFRVWNRLSWSQVTLSPGKSATFRQDLVSVWCE